MTSLAIRLAAVERRLPSSSDPTICNCAPSPAARPVDYRRAVAALLDGQEDAPPMRCDRCGKLWPVQIQGVDWTMNHNARREEQQ
jgi:hypothetical protein